MIPVEQQLRRYFADLDTQLELPTGPESADISASSRKGSTPRRLRPLSWQVLSVAASLLLIVALVALLGNDEEDGLVVTDGIVRPTEVQGESGSAAPSPVPTPIPTSTPIPTPTPTPTPEPTPRPSLGTATLTFNGVDYIAEIDDCVAEPDVLALAGRTDDAPDGVWRIEFDFQSRRDWDGDGIVDTIVIVRMLRNTLESFANPDFSYWEADINPVADPPLNDFTYERTANAIVAEGTLTDVNQLPRGSVTTPFTFEASCTPRS